MKYSIGIDVHGKGVHYQIESASGEDFGGGKLPKSMAGWRGLIEALAERGVDPAQSAAFVEATGRHHLPWCERLHGAGCAVYQLNPLLTKRLHSSSNAIRDNKTDKLDAGTLCEVGRIYRGKLERFAYRPQSQKLGLQSLVSSRKALREQCTNLLKAAGDLLELVCPEARRAGLKLSSRGARRLLAKAPTPGRLSELPLETIREAVGGKAQRLREAASESFTPERTARACSAALVQLLEAIDALFDSIERCDQAIEQASSKLPEASRAQRLARSVPGFGKVTAAVVVAFLPEDFEQWVGREEGRYKKKVAAKLQAHFGFDPRVRESGPSKGRTKLSKRGVEPARTALFQASVCSLLHDPQLRAYYDKKKAEGDHHTKAIVDVMRKNLRRLVSVLVDDKPFVRRVENAQPF